MEKIYGATEHFNGIVRIGQSRWEIFYGFCQEGETAYQWREKVNHKPALAEVKKIIFDQINENVQQQILKGMLYKKRMVWLSPENQRNIAFAYSLAKGGDTTSPLILKLGTDDDYVMYEFKNDEEVISFAINVQKHIEDAIAAGREEKTAIDWSCYEID